MFIAWNITYWEKQMNCSLSDSMDEPYRHAGQKKRHKWLSAAWSSRVDKTNSCDQKKKSELRFPGAGVVEWVHGNFMGRWNYSMSWLWCYLQKHIHLLKCHTMHLKVVNLILCQLYPKKVGLFFQRIFLPQSNITGI